MKVVFRKVLSIPEDGASCFLLLFEDQFKILLDCGINANLDLSRYRQLQDQLKDVQVVLISHSSLEYSGAYPFLVSELGLSPKIFFTTQPIMRYAPLSLHEQLLNLRNPSYNRKVFNRIYSSFEEMQLVKPHQKKEVELAGCQDKAIRKMQFTCYLAGGSLGSLYWRICYGLVNVVYLVNYNNYSLNHISGLDLDNLTTHPTHLLITDGYTRTNPLKKGRLQHQVSAAVLAFYNKAGVEPSKPRLWQTGEPQLLLACHPAELIIQLLLLLHRAVTDLSQGNSCEKIGVVHLSSRYLELVKSQSEYFSKQFKTVLEKMGENFEQTTTLRNRINVCSYHSLQGILADSPRNVEVCYLGSQSKRLPTRTKELSSYLSSLRLFSEEEEKLRSAAKLSLSKIESKMEAEEGDAKVEEMEAEDNGSLEGVQDLIKEEEAFNSLEEEKLEKKNFNSRFIALVSGIPRFNLNRREKNEEITELGLRHHTADETEDQPKPSLEQNDMEIGLSFEEKMLTKKQSKVEIMNIVFELPAISSKPPILPAELKEQLRNFHITEYHSSKRVIQLVRPQDIIFVNLPKDERLYRGYRSDVGQMQGERKVGIFNSISKEHFYLSYSNELQLYKMNYLPETQLRKVQKVRGTIIKENGMMQIHLECREDYEITEFHLERFFLRMKFKMDCKFTGYGIQVEGVNIYRKDNLIIMEGHYSEEYFKVRKALYQFLGLR